MIHSHEGRTLETSVFESFTVAKLPHRSLLLADFIPYFLFQSYYYLRLAGRDNRRRGKTEKGEKHVTGPYDGLFRNKREE